MERKIEKKKERDTERVLEKEREHAKRNLTADKRMCREGLLYGQ